MQISKFDLKSKKVVAQWDPQGGAILSEAQVVLRPGAEQEDDGVVVAPALDREGRSFVVVLDAGNPNVYQFRHLASLFCRKAHFELVCRDI